MTDPAPIAIPPPAPRDRRVPALDVLRGVAILLVIGRHMAAPPPEVASGIRAGADLWRQVGWWASIYSSS